MSNKVSAGLLMYRYGNDGLEVFLVKPTVGEGKEANWEMPKAYVEEEENSLSVAKREFAVETGIKLVAQELIPLDDIHRSSELVKAWAFEDATRGDGFELPLQSLLGKNESPLQLRRKHKYLMDKGCYFVMKEAVKKVFPEQVAQIKELQEILTVRNMIKNI